MVDVPQSEEVEQSQLSPEAISVLMSAESSDAVDSVVPAPAKKVRTESRQTQRVKASLRCTVMTSLRGKRTSLFGLTEDVSTGGVAWYSSENLPVQHTVAIRVEYQLKGKPECLVATGKIVGKVLWAAKSAFRYSVRFDKVSDAHLTKLQNYIDCRVQMANA